MNGLELVKLFNKMVDNTRVISITSKVLYLDKERNR